MEYVFSEIEKKWQEKWNAEKTFNVENPNYYVLSMWPYPSGSLHMGHLRNYCIGDVIARFKSLKGFKVLHPMGWDAFGLPAENAALDRGIHPKDWTIQNIQNMKRELISLGFSFDFSKEEASCLPNYYQFEQKMFIDFFNSGLAYKKESLVNWDPIDNTVLANEQVIEGKGWRSGAPIEKRRLSQWFLKISEFSEELLKDLEILNHWPAKVKQMQENWIGKSEGVRVTLHIKDSHQTIEIFTTRPETLYGVTFVAVSYGHAILELVTSVAVKDFIKECEKGSTKAQDMETLEKKGIFTGLYAINPVTYRLLPIYIANFVLMEYGTGAVCCCPSMDERDYEFAIKYNIPLIEILSSEPTSILKSELFEFKLFHKEDIPLLVTLNSENNKNSFFEGTSLELSKIAANTIEESAFLWKEKGLAYFAVFNCNKEFIGAAGFKFLSASESNSLSDDNEGVEMSINLLAKFHKYEYEAEIIKTLVEYASSFNIYAKVDNKNILLKSLLVKFDFKKSSKRSASKEEIFFYKKNAILQTERCILRPFQENDLEKLVSLHSDKDITKFMGGPETIQETEKTLTRYIKWQKENGFSRWAVFKKDTGEFIGRCGPGPFFDYEGKRFGLKNDIEIGYAYKKEFWGEGYATEILKAVSDWVFTNYPQVKRVIAATETQHFISQKVLKKAGFEYIGEDITTEKYGPESFFILKKPYILKTARLKIRPFREDDLENFIQIFIELQNNVVWKKILANKSISEMRSYAEKKLATYIERQEKLGFSRWAVILKETGELIGGIGLSYFNYDEPSNIIKKDDIKIGAFFLNKFQGAGYGAESGKAVAQWAFANLPVHGIYALTLKSHTLAVSLLKKNGAEYIGETSARNEGNESVYYLPRNKAAQPATQEGYMVNSGPLNGLSWEDAKRKMIQILEEKGLGCKVTNFRLKDWGVSRQRYWGCPIPVINCPSCGNIPVPEISLPITLPEDITIKPGENPLKTHPTWRFIDCPSCKSPAERETDTLDTFFESSWYFLRFSGGQKSDVAFESPLPVNDYIGGIEHAILHLLYARFFTKALIKCGYDISFKEPFIKLITQGMVCHKTFQHKSGKWITPAEAEKLSPGDYKVGPSIKMSKSKKNVIEPSGIVLAFGADTARFFMMSDTPPEKDFEWNNTGVASSIKFLKKIWKVGTSLKDIHSSPISEINILKFLYKTLFNYQNEIERVELNKAVVRIRELFNFIEMQPVLEQRFLIKYLLIMLKPFTPHIASEIAEILKIEIIEFPAIKEEYLVENIVNISIQVNGKLRGALSFESNISQEIIREAILKTSSIFKYLDGKKIVKEIYIKNKTYSFVCN